MSQNKGCHELPLFRYTWPGRDEQAICVRHSLRLAAVAGAMGLPIQLVPLTPEEQRTMSCSQEDAP